MLRKIQKTSSKISQRLRIAIVASKYNPELTDELLAHCLRTLGQQGVFDVQTVRVPGCYEIPVVVMHLARQKKFDALIALGVVIKGKTSHAGHITLASSIHLQKIAIETGIPVIHQILSPKNLRDARTRTALRGVEAALTAIEMAVQARRLPGKSSG